MVLNFILLQISGLKIILIAISIIIFIVKLAIKNDSSTNSSSKNPISEKELSASKKMYAICKDCTHKKMDLKTGIQCGLTNSKPNFTDICSDFKQKQF